MADSLGLNGYVKNEPDGSVYMEVEGEEEKVNSFTEWCRKGPEHAEVMNMKVTRQPLCDFEGFGIEKR